MGSSSLIRNSKVTKILISLFLIILSVIWLFPLFFALIGSMKTAQEYNLTFFWDMPEKNNWLENYRYVAKYTTVFESFFNTLLYALCGSLGAVLIAIFAAYGVTKLDIKHKMFWFMIIYSGTIFPFQLFLIPVFSAYKVLGLNDTRFGIILFYIAICIPFSMFVLRNFFLGISNEISEAARIDGASKFRILWNIIVPMSIAPISVVFLTQFSWCFNELLFGLTFAKSADILPIMATISTLTKHNIPAVFLACAIASIPTVVLYFLINKNFDKGFAYSSQ